MGRDNEEVTFTQSELLAEMFRAAQPENGTGPVLTTREIAQQVGYSKDWVLTRLHELDAQGRLGTTHKMIEKLGGERQRVRAYYLKSEEE